METRHPVKEPFGSEFPVICNHCGLMTAWSRKTRKFCEKFLHLKKTTPYSKIFKILFRKFSPHHRLTLLCWNVVKFLGRVIGKIVLYLLDKKNLAPSQTVATVQIAPKICHGQPPTFGSHSSRFHSNWFTFGGVIAERVKAVFCPIEYFHDRLFEPIKRKSEQRWHAPHSCSTFFNSFSTCARSSSLLCKFCRTLLILTSAPFTMTTASPAAALSVCWSIGVLFRLTAERDDCSHNKLPTSNMSFTVTTGLVTLTLDWVILHTVVHHSSTSTYMPNFI